MSQTSGSATIYFNTKGENQVNISLNSQQPLGIIGILCRYPHTWPHSTKHLGKKLRLEIKQSRTILLLPPYISLPSNKYNEGNDLVLSS